MRFTKWTLHTKIRLKNHFWPSKSQKKTVKAISAESFSRKRSVFMCICIWVRNHRETCATYLYIQTHQSNHWFYTVRFGFCVCNYITRSSKFRIKLMATQSHKTVIPHRFSINPGNSCVQKQQGPWEFVCPEATRSSSLRALFFFVSRRIASRIHEISDLKKALVLSLRAGYTRLRDKKKHTEHERNAER